jgi:anaerobic selenocysteine-containing dehydrogenase
MDPVAGYTPSHESSQHDTTLARGYPLALITPANHYFLNSIFANVPRQRQRSGAATLLIHPDDAAPRQIATGDKVRVANAQGAFFAVADVSDHIRPGVVASTKGRWPGFSKEGATINATVDERDSDMGGGAVYHDNRVRVEKVSALDAGLEARISEATVGFCADGRQPLPKIALRQSCLSESNARKYHAYAYSLPKNARPIKH